jgi:superfamily II DNA or RNA helicase
MDEIKVKNKNHATMQIGCDYGIANELSEFFSFFVPGYKFMPAYKNRVWDGKIRLFNSQTMELPIGLFPFLKEFAKPRQYKIEVLHDNYYGRPDSVVETDPLEVQKFLKELNICSRGAPIEVRDYQFDAICEGIHRKRGILISPTGSGKSLIIYALAKYYLEKTNSRKKILIIVPTTSLVEQMYSDFGDYGDNSDCHKIYSGKDKVTDKNIIISTWQSIYKLQPGWFEQFGCVIGDECHGFKSKSLTTIMSKCKEAEYRFGTTGTLDGSQTHELVLQGLFGKVYRVTTTKKLQDADTLAKLKINILLLKYPEEVRKNWGKQDYQHELDYIVTHKGRNNFIRNLALDLNGNTLVLFQFVEKHGKPLFNDIRDTAHESRKIFFVSGGTDTTDREAIRQIVETQKNSIIVASLGTFSTGINIRNIHNIIFASPSKSQIRVLQSIGRALRQSDDGRSAALYDIADDLHWRARKNYTLEHSGERIKIYSKEQFDYKVFEVNISE